MLLMLEERGERWVGRLLTGGLAATRAAASPPMPAPVTPAPTAPAPVAGVHNRRPVAAIAAPRNGRRFRWHATIRIRVTARDPDGRIARVVVRDGAKVLSHRTSFRWRHVRAGRHTLTARVTDSAGAATTSARVRITVRRRHR
jgi:hypothetical protein